MSAQRIDKQLVCRQFQRAADSYDRQALIQQRTAEHLLDLLAEHSERPPQRVLEIGCGTGLLTRRLIERINGIQELVLNDLVPDFASRLDAAFLPVAVSFLPGDIEALPLTGCFDLIISSSTLHWLDDLDALLTKLAAHLNPGGILAFSLYGPDNLLEIKALTGIGLRYRSQAEIETMLHRQFRVIHSSSMLETLHFVSPYEVLRHLRQTGVNTLSRNQWNRARIEQFSAEYRCRFSSSQGVVLSYHPLYFSATKDTAAMVL